MTDRIGRSTRTTSESDITVEINLDGTGRADIDTGLPFFDHMLTAFAVHGSFDLTVHAKGDIEIDAHHTVEDTAIVLGRALLDAVATRLLAVENRKIVSYPGGWADYVRAQEEPPPQPAVAAPPKPKKARPPRARKPEPTALELVEREVARAEARVSELETKLAEDWGDMALLTAHREAREDLQALLARWEALMERA